MNSRGIQVNAHQIGEISVDLEQVRGDGGPYNPRLVVPIEIVLHPRPVAQALAVTSLTCTLYAGEIAPTTQIGEPVTCDVSHGFPARTSPDAPSRTVRYMHFPLTDASIALTERHRHRAPENMFQGWLTASVSVAWLFAAGGQVPGPRSVRSFPDYPFDLNMGICIGLAHFLGTRIENIPLWVPASTWINKVLPGVGLNHLRLVEMFLPRVGGALPAEIIPHFDAARLDYDAGRYRECIQKCRDVRKPIETLLKATRSRPVGDALADVLGTRLPEDQRKFLNQWWNALVDFSSAAHHQTAYTQADARACLLLTATILEYLQSLLSPAPLGYAVLS